MIALDYAAEQIRGVWRMASNDEAWRDDFDFSLDGVFKSLWAIAIAMPFSLLLQMAVIRAAEQSENFDDTLFAAAPTTILLAIDVVTTIIGWGVGIAFFAFVAKQMGASRSAAAIIVAFNWSRCLTAMASSAAAIAYFLSRNTDIFAALLLPASIFGIFLLWTIIRKLLPAGPGTTAMLIVSLFVLNLAATSIATSAALALYRLVS